MDDFHGPAAEDVGRPDDQGIADGVGDLLRLGLGTGEAVFRLLEAQVLEQHLEALPVLGQVDGVRRGAEDGDAHGFQRLRELQRRLAAQLHDDAVEIAVGLFDPDQLDHVLGGQGLEIKPVGGVVVGGHRFRVAVDHDRLQPHLLQGIGGMAAAVIELDALADAVRAAAEDHHLGPVGRLGFAFGHAQAVALVGRIHVGRLGRKLGGAGVDALVHRLDGQFLALGSDGRRRHPGQFAEPVVGKAQHLQPQ